MVFHILAAYKNRKLMDVAGPWGSWERTGEVGVEGGGWIEGLLEILLTSLWLLLNLTICQNEIQHIVLICWIQPPKYIVFYFQTCRLLLGN